MSKAYESIKQGLTEAIDFAQGKATKAIIHSFSSVDVKAVREQVGMSQTEGEKSILHEKCGDYIPR